MANIGLPEIAIVLVIVLVIFGPKRLPQLGRSLGGGMREFKDAVTGNHKDDEHDAIESPPPIPADRVTNASANASPKPDETAAAPPARAADPS